MTKYHYSPTKSRNSAPHPYTGIDDIRAVCYPYQYYFLENNA